MEYSKKKWNFKLKWSITEKNAQSHVNEMDMLHGLHTHNVNRLGYGKRNAYLVFLGFKGKKKNDTNNSQHSIQFSVVFEIFPYLGLIVSWNIAKECHLRRARNVLQKVVQGTVQETSKSEYRSPTLAGCHCRSGCMEMLWQKCFTFYKKSKCNE